MPTSRTRTSSSLHRTSSSASAKTAQPLQRSTSRSSFRSTKSPIPRSAPTHKALPIAPPIHVAPEEPPREWTASPSLTFNPFEGRLFGSVSPVMGRQSHEFPDSGPFSSPKPYSGRGSRSGPFIFSDLDLDNDSDDSVYSKSKVTQLSPINVKYENLEIEDHHGTDEEDVFLDDKHKTQSFKFATIKKKALAAVDAMSKRYWRIRDKHPRACKFGWIALISLIPLWIVAFITLGIIANTAFRAPIIYTNGSLNTTSLRAGAWGFDFNRALNLTMVNQSPMTVNFGVVEMDIDLTQVQGAFTGNTSAILDFTLGKNGDSTTFLLPISFAYNSQADINGTTLQVLLQGCGLATPSTPGIAIDMFSSGNAKVFGIFNRNWISGTIGAVIPCDTFLQDAVRYMAQQEGMQLSN